MISRCIMALFWTILLLFKVNAASSGTSNHAFSATFNFIAFNNPVSVFEVQGAHEVNKFTSGGLYRARINENAGIGSLVTSPVKMGLYIPETNVKVEYLMSGVSQDTQQTASNCLGTKMFSVKSKRIENFYALQLRTKRMLSEGSCESYLLTVKAQDSEGKEIIDSTRVLIEVQVSGHMDQHFDKPNRSESIPLNFPLFQPIVQLHTANKHDIGKVYFFLKEQSKYFGLDPVSGVLFLKRSLPVATNQHDLVARVRRWDSKFSRKTLVDNTCIITIVVKAINQYSPSITLNKAIDNLENKENTILARITVSDLDEGKNGRIDSLVISSGDEQGYFRLERVAKNNTDFLLRLAKPLSSKLSRFGLTLTATDRGNPPKSSTIVHRVKLENLLPTKPRFPNENYYVNVSEMMPVNSTVIQVNAVNLNPNFRFLYSIVHGDPSNMFRIKPDTGEISVAGTLDAETTTLYILKIALNVIGEDSAVISANIHIQVEDFNDHAPKFTADTHYVEIQEDMAPHTSIYKVEAKDDDSGDNGLVSYWLPHSSKFSIHPNTGVISVRQVSDRDRGIPEYAYVAVRAGDNGSPIRRETETIVKIRIKAWNDNGPVIKQNDCSITLSSDTPVGTKLLQIEAIDIDVDKKNQPSFLFSIGSNVDYFKLDSTTGDITVAKPLSDARNSYSLVVVANDGTHKSENSAFLKITIGNKETGKDVTCTDSSAYLKALKLNTGRKKISTSGEPFIDRTPPVNSWVPRFTHREMTIAISEDIAIGSVLVTLKATDNDNGYEGLVTYYIVGGNFNQHFGVDSLTGELKTTAKLDREQKSKYKLNVSAWDSGISRKADFIKVVVKVTDLNDNAPVFDHEIYNITCSEKFPVGQTALKIHARDNDERANRRVTYHLVNNNNKHFFIDYNSGDLIINKPLDFEKEKMYVVKVLAMDGSSINQHASQADVILNVLDENDNSPVINPVMQNVFVMRDLPAQSPVTQVTADDPDTGDGGTLNFILAKSHGSELFSVDGRTGLLKLKRSLASSTTENYNLTIIVSDNGQPHLSSHAYVNVHVLQRVGDGDIQILNNHVGITEYIVPENIPPGYQIVKLTKANVNPEIQNSFLFSIIDGTDITMFDIANTSGLLTTTGSLDHEEIPYYWITIQIVARQSGQFYKNIHLLIKIEDTNDNYPIFDPPVYESKIPENTKADESVVKVSASDRDSGENGKLTYSIVKGNGERHFKIDHVTGLISTTDLPLDYEKKKVYQLEISVTDTGSEPKTTQAWINVLIQDENDNSPEFKENLDIDFLISDTSTIPKDTLLGQVLASDKDEGDNGDLTFTILSGNQDMKLRIDPKSGLLFSNVVLSSLDAFQLEVEVKDNGHQPLSTKTKIDITVTEHITFGSNPPTFPQKQVNVSLSENIQVGHQIDIVPATDKDGDILAYSIKAGNDGRKFQIDRRGKSLKLVAELDLIKPNLPVYPLVISATDGLYACNFTLNIHVEDINDHYPIPEMIEKIVSVLETVPPGTKLVTVKATDLDFGINSQIKYSFKSAVVSKSLTLFDINPSTGEITVKAGLDYEDMSSHVLIVAITDRGDQPKQSLMYVVVNVEDVNEWKPEFIKPSHYVVIQENTPPGSDVVKVLAKDKDQGQDAMLKYSIISGNHGYAFTIKPLSGVIQTNRVFKATQISEYVLTIEARDDGAHGLSATTNVTVKLLSRGNRPGFAKDVFSVSMYENQPMNTFVEYVGFSGLMTFYTIVNGTDCANGFKISQFSGAITTQRVFDAEKISSCSFQVKAEDGDGFIQESTVTVDIKDWNDNRPLMEEEIFHGYVHENPKENSVVLNAKGQPLVIAARDDDVELRNRELKYEIISPGINNYFQLNENTGELFTSRFNIDYEVEQSYNFLVKVSDKGEPSLSDVTTVVVHVTNVNDVAPEFSKDMFEVLVYLPTYEGVHVTMLTASDRDKLGNITFSISQQDTPSLLAVDASSGRVIIGNPSKSKEGWYNAVVEVTDGIFTRNAKLRVLFKPIPVSSLRFSRPSFQAHVSENTSVVQTVLIPFATGYKIQERIKFGLGNFQDKFTIKESTGVIKTKAGVVMDREQISSYHLVIIVQDDSTPPRIAHSVVDVIVDDVNDCKPTFPPPPIFFVVSKNSRVGSTVATIAASDCDSGKNGEIRYHIKSDKSKTLGIESNTGALKVLRDLVGLTASTEFKLIIEANDLGEKPLRSEAEVSVRIEPGDACIFERPSYQFELAEDATVGKVFEKLHARCPKGKPVFTIMSGDNFGQFSCDLNTGELSLTSELDFEKTSSYMLDIRAKDSDTGTSSTVTVSISVKDINDNTPTFQRSLYFARIRENSPEGTVLMHLASNDLDSGENQKRYYEIAKDDAGMFAIDNLTGTLSITKKVDYEKDKGFGITVRVTDHGQPSLSSEALVKVFVIDENDNAPRFLKPNYSATVLGNAGPSQFITRVLATDEDETDISNLRYRIVSGTGMRFFLVDAKSGVVSLSKVPGLVLGEVYVLKLAVNDGNFTAYTKLDVVVGQTNNHPPVFKRDLIHAQVAENYPADSYVAMVTATDQDSGDFGEVVYTMDSQKAAQDFKIDEASGIITTRRPLDREVMSSIIIPIRATDKGGKSTFCSVQVTILDENDNQPQFLMSAYTASVSVAQASVGESVLKVTAIDQDEDENSALTYGLVGQTSPFVFGINSTSGAISFLRKPRESTYNFYVRVRDKGHLKLKSYAQVHVSVDSLIFQFKLRKYTVSISESVQGSVHQKVQLIDNKGALVTSNVDYSIEVGTTLSTNKLGTFSVNSLGELLISKTLDYETVRSYDLVVRANRSSFSAFTTVHVEVLDENDNKPEFEADSYVASVPEDSTRGTKVVQVRAHDKDSKENGMVTYEISAESKKLSNIFTVDKNTGWITTNDRLDRETTPSYILQINAKDHGRDENFVSTTRVNINLTDVNDSPPLFSKGIYERFIKEDSPVGSEVLTLDTTDKDAKSQIVYYIVSGDNHNQFIVDQTSGKIYLNEKLDREILPRYLLIVTASDGAFISSTLIKIEVVDVNDNKPICHPLNLAVSIPENVTVGRPIATVNATDLDTGNNSRITFAIFSHREKFSVDHRTGIIKLDHRLDREKKSRYNFIVSASDGRSACYTNVTIDLLDINDNPPEFTKSHYTKPIAIDAEVNSVLLRVEAFDQDEGVNRKVSYAFKNASNAFPFSIEKETGIISLKSRLLSLDRENFNFNVIAMDSGVPSLSSEAGVEIVVSSIKNCPFVKEEYKSEIPEDTRPRHEIETISVTCSGGKFNITYKITDENDEIHRLFEINENTGILYLKASLDYEISRVHMFTVEALMVKPSGKTILISSTSVKIKVADCNDNKPVFNRKCYNATVDEDSPKKSLVIALFAADNDTSDEITYTITKSLPDATKFEINAVEGIITVHGSLDREETEQYELMVRAQDNGNPPLFSDVPVFISINDLNDNPPVVEEEIKTLVRADTPVDSVVLQLKPTDADGPSNSKPFKFSILSGENNMFKLNSFTGILRTKRRLSLRNTKMTIRTTDSGSPPMYADTTVEITVVKHSLNSPVVRPVTVYVNMLASSFKGGIIGKVVAYDEDKDDILQYSLVKGNSKFSVSPTDGTIRVNSVLDLHSYSFEVQVTDGTHEVNAQVSVHAKEITSKVVDNSVTIRITGKTLSSFVSSSLSSMINTLARLMHCSLDEVYLWSIQAAEGNKLDVVFAIKKPGGKEFFDPNQLRETLEDQLQNFQKTSNIYVSSVGIFPCDERQCTPGKDCRNKIKVLNNWSILSSNTTTFLSYKNEQYGECICPEGESGPDCFSSIPTKCLENPCKSGLQCIDRPTGYECICPKGKNCQEQCRGDECYADAMTFNGNSYIQYSLVDEKSNKLSSFSVSVRTTKSSGTIFSAKGDYDYFILEVVEGKIRVRFNYGSGEGVGRIDQMKINDGKWYDVKVARKERRVRLTLNPGNYMAEAVALGSMRFLNVDMNNLIVGGELPRRSIRSTSAVSNGYFGCMENPRLNGNDLPLSGFNAMAKATIQGVTPNCAVCNPSFCQNGGQCKVVEQNGNEVPICTCKPGFTGYDCGEDVNECELLPCKNSGVCVNIIGSFKCNCLDRNFQGSLCETSVSAVSRPEPLGTMEFIYIGATVFVLIIIAIIIVCACRCVHKRRRKAKARRRSEERLELKIKEAHDEMPRDPPPPPPRRGDVEDPPATLDSRAPSWDYADLPEMVPSRRKISESSSFLSLPAKSFEDLGEYSGINGVPQVPKRPRRISETQGVPDVPEKPMQYRCSRASSQNSVRSRSLADVSEIGDEGLDIIRQGRKDIDELVSKAADVVDNIFGTNCASPPSESDARSECSQVGSEIFTGGHLETYDASEVAYFIPENDQDNTNENDSEDETSTMLEKLPKVKNSKGEALHKESKL